MRIEKRSSFGATSGGGGPSGEERHTAASAASTSTVLPEDADKGAAKEVLRDDLLSQVYACAVRTNITPAQGIPFVLPHAGAGPPHCR